ncbi:MULTISPECIES: PIN domain-containing protein [Sphingomonas]|uniref:PIN domain-containing protein n=1 Tax=Sphingomonas TaxID=13687 RepID=UPI0008325121|nr:PIN domain-containing protein [Sphingomonas sp. CCH10-B3]MBA3879288.1 PIN domain-containing protein [Sphingobium sp.]
MKRVALDTNILAYFVGVRRVAEDDAKIHIVRRLIADLASATSLIAPAQTLGELMVVLARAGKSAAEARAIVLEIADGFGTAASERQTVVAAADLMVDHGFQFWDSLIVTAAIEAGCTLLLSEDMHHGFVVRGLTIINPLASERHPKLSTLVG